MQPGQVTGFLGPNGAGKTTTMRLVLGLDRPQAGSVTVAGRSFSDYRFPLYEVGALLDAKAVHGGRRARDHLLCLAQSNRISRRRVEEVLELVGLSDVARRRVATFSLGMTQRLGIAAALLGDPPVLMFDEPVNGLDPDSWFCSSRWAWSSHWRQSSSCDGMPDRGGWTRPPSALTRRRGSSPPDGAAH